MMSTSTLVDGCPKTVIIGLSAYAQELADRTKVFMDQHGFKEWERPTFEQMSELVYALIDDHLNEAMIWAKTSITYADALFDKHLPWFNAYKTNPMFQDIHDLYVTEILDHVEVRIHEVMDTFLPDRTWDVWYMTKFGKDLMIVRGQDYRVLDWERRMASGQWKDYV